MHSMHVGGKIVIKILRNKKMQCNIKTIQCAKTLNSKTLYRLLFYYWWWERICFLGVKCKTVIHSQRRFHKLLAMQNFGAFAESWNTKTCSSVNSTSSATNTGFDFCIKSVNF